MSERTRSTWQGLAGAAVLLAFLGGTWQTYAAKADHFFLPTPEQIGARLADEWLTVDVAHLFLTSSALTAIGQTFATAVVAWLIAALLGICLGVLTGSVRLLDEITQAPFLLLRSIPGVALIPIFIAILGLGSDMRIAVVAIGCVWPVLLNTAAGIRQLEPLYLDVSRVMRQGHAARILTVLLPAIMPKVFAGLRVSLAFALVMTVATEMLAGSGGLGALAIRYRSTFDVSGLWATLAVLAACGLLLNAVVVLSENSLLKWHKKWRSASE